MTARRTFSSSILRNWLSLLAIMTEKHYVIDKKNQSKFSFFSFIVTLFFTEIVNKIFDTFSLLSVLFR